MLIDEGWRKREHAHDAFPVRGEEAVPHVGGEVIDKQNKVSIKSGLFCKVYATVVRLLLCFNAVGRATD